MQARTIDSPDSGSVFKPFWLCWHLLGVTAWKNRNYNMVYNTITIIFVSFWYPIHLFVGLLLLPKQQDIFKNLSMTITCIVCTIKHFCIRWKIKDFDVMMNLFKQLDKRAKTPKEREYFTRTTMRNATLISKMYFIVYMSANAAALVATAVYNEHRLMYPAWFPFDWNSSLHLYYLAFVYQFVGITILIVQNYSQDAIAPVTLCLLSGHVRLLALRVENIGGDCKKTQQENEVELKYCIEDHITLIRLAKVIENALSYVQLSLFISSGLNACVVLVYLLFYFENMFTLIYYTIFLFAIAVELFPIYYYGSVLEEEFKNLPYAIFSSNWQSQSRSFRQSCVIFMEVTKRGITLLGGSIVPIRLDSFFAICKTTYSLFAVVIRLK